VVQLTGSPSSVVSAGAWVNAANVFTSNNVYATNTGATQNTEYPMEIGGFDFSTLPSDATISGTVAVGVECLANANSRAQIKIELMDGATVIGTLPLTAVTTTEGFLTLNASPSVAQLKSPNLKVRVTNKRIASQAATTSVDYVRIVVDYTAPIHKMETLSDDFATQINPSVWGSYNSVSWEAGRVRAVSVQAYSGVYTLSSFDLRESYAFAKVTPPPAATSRETMLSLSAAVHTEGVYFGVVGSPRSLMFRRRIGNVDTDSYAAYDPVQHVWLRVRLIGTTAYWDTAPDGVTWTNRFSITTTSNLSAVQFEMSVGQWAAETDTQPGYFDNVNVVPITGGRPKVWTGSAWANKPAKVWTGSAWVEKPVKVWSGSAWVLAR